MPKFTRSPSSALVSLMDEYGLNPYSLSKDIGLSYAVTRMLVLGKTRMSAPTALRLAKYFGNTPAFWLDIQQEADLDKAAKNKKLQSGISKIKRAVKQAPGSKGAAKPRGKTLSDKRKAAAKAPGAKPASRKKK